MPLETAETIEAAGAARAAWDEFQERVVDLKAAMRRCPSSAVQHELRRVEAYDALVGRDEGMGYSMTTWLDEIKTAASGESDEETE